MYFDISIILLIIIFSIVGYKKGFLYTLLDLLSIVFAMLFSYLILPLFVNMFESLIKSLNISSYKLDELLKTLFMSNSKFSIFVKDLLKISNFNNVNSVIILFRTIAYIILALILKKLLKLYFVKGFNKIKKFMYIGGKDKVIGSILGFCVGVFICSIISFVIVGFYSGGVFSSDIAIQIKNSDLLNHLNGVVFDLLA